MVVLREVVARLTLDVDQRGFNAAEKSISGTTQALQTMGTVATAAFAGMGVGLALAIDRAADANETLNLMGLTFKENTDDVVAWGAAFSQAAGRSEFELREMATQLGSVLTPLLDNNIDQATEFAQALSERAVDFGSARNVSDLEASQAFISGLTGETEPLKRFGIVMTDAALGAFALQQGITKTTRKMSEAEKTQLRYQFLMSRTAVFQDDAANTAESYANATKALRAGLTDLGTRLGLKFLPAAERVVRVTRDVVAVIGNWVESSNIIEAALITLGTIAVAVATRILVSWAAANVPLILMAAAVGLLILVVDDFLTFLQGGDSVIGAFIDSIWGPGSATEAVKNLQAGWEILQESLKNGLAFFKTFIQEFVSSWLKGLDLVEARINSYLDTVTEIFRVAGDFLGLDNVPRTSVRGIGPRPTAVAAAAGGAQGGGQVINQSTTVNVQGNATAADAGRIADRGAEAQRRENRRTRAALTQRSGT